MNIVEHAALVENKVCAVFSLEMPRIQLAQRLMCSYARVSMSKALSGELSQGDWKNLWKASAALKKAKIYIDDSSKISPAEILSKCRRLKTRKDGLDMIMIDYIQLMEMGGRLIENRQQEIANITRNLKIMAKELDVPVLALSQLRRISSKEEPQLSDLRESGAIEQDADMVMFIHRPDVAATEEEIKSGKIIKDAADLIIAKHRNGELGRVKLRFRGDQVRYVNPPPGFLPTNRVRSDATMCPKRTIPKVSSIRTTCLSIIWRNTPSPMQVPKTARTTTCRRLTISRPTRSRRCRRC